MLQTPCDGLEMTEVGVSISFGFIAFNFAEDSTAKSAKELLVARMMPLLISNKLFHVYVSVIREG